MASSLSQIIMVIAHHPGSNWGVFTVVRVITCFLMFPGLFKVSWVIMIVLWSGGFRFFLWPLVHPVSFPGSWVLLEGLRLPLVLLSFVTFSALWQGSCICSAFCFLPHWFCMLTQYNSLTNSICTNQNFSEKMKWIKFSGTFRYNSGQKIRLDFN